MVIVSHVLPHQCERLARAAVAVSLFPWLVMAYREVGELWRRLPEPGGGVDALAGLAIPVGVAMGAVVLLVARRSGDHRARAVALVAVGLGVLLLAHIVWTLAL